MKIIHWRTIQAIPQTVQWQRILTPAGELIVLYIDDSIVSSYFNFNNRPIEEWIRELFPNQSQTIVIIEKKEQLLPSSLAQLAQLKEVYLAEFGTPFQQNVWEELMKIPYGSTISYTELAKRLGNLEAIRAVAAAVGKNPFAYIIPCHRVIGNTGKLTGFRWGIETKNQLLQIEKGIRQMDINY